MHQKLANETIFLTQSVISIGSKYDQILIVTNRQVVLMGFKYLGTKLKSKPPNVPFTMETQMHTAGPTCVLYFIVCDLVHNASTIT